MRAVSRGENGIEYLYGPEQQRIRQVVSSPAGTATTYYLNGLDSLGLTYEREQRSGGTVEHRHYLSAAGSVFGILNIKTKTIEGAGAGVQASPPRTELRYLHRDALGSVGAITGEEGQLVERLAYDPWGKRRFPSGQADPQGGLGAQTGERTSARGFTLHEHLDEVGLVHMNARLYDPLLGRFTAADAIVDGALDLQGYNRYSYGQNNPLAGADPSGNSFWSGLNPFSSRNLDVLFNTLANPFSAHQVHALIHRDPGIQIGDQTVQRYPVVGQIAQVAVVAVVSYFTFGTGAVAAGAISGPWAVAAIAGAAGASAALTTNALGGDSSDYWRAGLISAATTAAFYGVGAATGGFTGIEGAVIKIGAHALVGCASAAASGGECAHGAVAAAIGKGVSLGLGEVFNQPDGSKWLAHQKVIGFIATSVAGGTASALSGGKFANGATTAAFGYLLNHLSHWLELAAYGREAHQILQDHFEDRGYVVEARCATATNCVNGRFDIADPRTREVWEIKRNSFFGLAMGVIAIEAYTTPETGLRPGGDLIGFRVGADLSFPKSGATYTFTNYGDGLIGYSRFAPANPIKIPVLGPVPGGAKRRGTLGD